MSVRIIQFTTLLHIVSSKKKRYTSLGKERLLKSLTAFRNHRVIRKIDFYRTCKEDSRAVTKSSLWAAIFQRCWVSSIPSPLFYTRPRYRHFKIHQNFISHEAAKIKQCFAYTKMEIVVFKSILNLAEILLVSSNQISNISQPVVTLILIYCLSACMTHPFLVVNVLDQK